jgi:hypothetical protein
MTDHGGGKRRAATMIGAPNCTNFGGPRMPRAGASRGRFADIDVVARLPGPTATTR